MIEAMKQDERPRGGSRGVLPSFPSYSDSSPSRTGQRSAVLSLVVVPQRGLRAPAGLQPPPQLIPDSGQQFYKGNYNGHLENLCNSTGMSPDALDPAVENLTLAGRNLFRSAVSLEAHNLADVGLGGEGVTVCLIIPSCSLMLMCE